MRRLARGGTPGTGPGARASLARPLVGVGAAGRHGARRAARAARTGLYAPGGAPAPPVERPVPPLSPESGRGRAPPAGMRRESRPGGVIGGEAPAAGGDGSRRPRRRRCRPAAAGSPRPESPTLIGESPALTGAVARPGLGGPSRGCVARAPVRSGPCGFAPVAPVVPRRPGAIRAEGWRRADPGTPRTGRDPARPFVLRIRSSSTNNPRTG